MATVHVKVEGLKEVGRQLEKIKGDIVKILQASLYQEAEDIMKESKTLVPVDTGNLRSTGHVQLPKVTLNRVSVALGYGGPSAKYAIYVHENMQAWHKPPTRAKYLEAPFNKNTANMDVRLAKRLKVI